MKGTIYSTTARYTYTREVIHTTRTTYHIRMVNGWDCTGYPTEAAALAEAESTARLWGDKFLRVEALTTPCTIIKNHRYKRG